MFDTKTNLLACVDAKSWPFKNWRSAQNAKIWNAHYNPPKDPRAKKFWISKFLPRGYHHTKNDQNWWVGGVKLLRSALEWAIGMWLHRNPHNSAISGQKNKNFMRYGNWTKRSISWDQPEICSFSRLEMGAEESWRCTLAFLQLSFLFSFSSHFYFLSALISKRLKLQISGWSPLKDLFV